MAANRLSLKLAKLQQEVIACRLCPRLVAHREAVASAKRRAYLRCEYWGRPVPSFGDPAARLLIVGLAPGAHGANRTGRMFTGDSSGDFLYKALFDNGFASQPNSTGRSDGLHLIDAYITAPVRCAPPGNKPTREEFAACRPFLERELDLLANVKVVVTLGRLALDAYLGVPLDRKLIQRRSGYPFSHGAHFRLPSGLPTLLCCYHPSRQNTQTGVLTMQMLQSVFGDARRMLG
ncbi:MAG: uracil-DNA glycosylase [Bryobacterales bacterium]